MYRFGSRCLFLVEEKKTSTFHSSSDPPYFWQHTYHESSWPCPYSAPWGHGGSYSFLRSSSSLVLLCLWIPSPVTRSKYGGEWLILPYTGINPCIGSRFLFYEKKTTGLPFFPFLFSLYWKCNKSVSTNTHRSICHTLPVRTLQSLSVVQLIWVQVNEYGRLQRYYLVLSQILV